MSLKEPIANEIPVDAAKDVLPEAAPLILTIQPHDDGSGSFIERVADYDDEPLSPRARRLQSISKYTIILSLVLLFAGELLHYVFIWKPKVGFTYSIGLVASIYMIGLTVFVGSAGYQTYVTESDRKPLWWAVYAGAIFSFLQTAIVIFKCEEFVAPQITGKLIIAPAYIAVYVVAFISTVLLAFPMILIDLYGRSLKRARFFRALIITGIVTKQISMLVTIHSFVSYIGFALFVTGCVLATSGYVLGLWEAHRRKRKYRLFKHDSEDN